MKMISKTARSWFTRRSKSRSWNIRLSRQMTTRLLLINTVISTMHCSN